MKKIIVDMDSSARETYGQQEGTAYNGISDAPAIVPFSA
jgi:hypothetical protein